MKTQNYHDIHEFYATSNHQSWCSHNQNTPSVTSAVMRTFLFLQMNEGVCYPSNNPNWMKKVQSLQARLDIFRWFLSNNCLRLIVHLPLLT
jgi:hypothetical protein